MQPVVLLSDFGTSDGYAAVMRGVILSYNPSLAVHDATHQIRQFSIRSASYVLHTLLSEFPVDTVFVCVVDPGVGSDRRELIARIDGRIVVAPDNGLITLASLMAETREFHRAKPSILAELRAAKRPYSQTFDGRDLFAPLGARIATLGLGPVVDATSDYVLDETLRPVPLPESSDDITQSGREVAAQIIHIDSFGNAITSLRREGASGEIPGTALCGGHAFPMHGSFSGTSRGDALSYWGSYGFLELAVREGSAEADFGLEPGMTVTFTPLVDTPGSENL